MLSTHAKKFLSTLKRHRSIPTKEVEIIIKNGEYPCFTSWLDFHEQYAGYVEIFGQDRAVWGLAHEKPVWLPSREVEIDQELNTDIWYITCADVHPSYTYQLDNKGNFLGFDAESFDINVERKALVWFFYNAGKSKVLYGEELIESNLREIFVSQIKPDLVPEASDRFFRYYMNDKYLLVENARTEEFIRVTLRV